MVENIKFVLQIVGFVFMLIALNYAFDKIVYQGSAVHVYHLTSEGDQTPLLPGVTP